MGMVFLSLHNSDVPLARRIKEICHATDVRAWLYCGPDEPSSGSIPRNVGAALRSASSFVLFDSPRARKSGGPGRVRAECELAATLGLIREGSFVWLLTEAPGPWLAQDPLVELPDWVYLDTTAMPVEEVAERVLRDLGHDVLPSAISEALEELVDEVPDSIARAMRGHWQWLRTRHWWRERSWLDWTVDGYTRASVETAYLVLMQSTCRWTDGHFDSARELLAAAAQCWPSDPRPSETLGALEDTLMHDDIAAYWLKKAIALAEVSPDDRDRDRIPRLKARLRRLGPPYADSVSDLEIPAVDRELSAVDRLRISGNLTEARSRLDELAAIFPRSAAVRGHRSALSAFLGEGADKRDADWVRRGEPASENPAEAEYYRGLIEFADGEYEFARERFTLWKNFLRPDRWLAYPYLYPPGHELSFATRLFRTDGSRPGDARLRRP